MTIARSTNGSASVTAAWGIEGLDLRCPRCGYDVQGLPQPRCPECGLRFRWLDLIAAAITPNGRLFEQQWRHRPVRSFALTFLVALWPPALWRRTPLESRPCIGPLVLLAAVLWLVYLALRIATERVWGWYFGIPLGWYWDDYLNDAFHRTIALALPVVAVWLALRVFWQTRRSYRIREDQLLRLMLLSWVALLAWRVVFTIGWGVFVTSAFRQPWFSSVYGWLWSLHGSVPLLAMTVALCTGLQSHVRVRRGWSTGLLALMLVIVTLVLLCVWAGVHLNNGLLDWFVGTLSLEWDVVTTRIGRILLWGAMH